MSVRLTGESEQDYYASQAPTAARVSVPKQGWSSSDTATAVAIGAVAGAAIGIAAAASGVDIVESATRIYEKLDFEDAAAQAISNAPFAVSSFSAGVVYGSVAKKTGCPLQ